MTPCAAGSFSDADGAAECAPCAAGTFQASKGSLACGSCTAGGYCEVGAVAPSLCEAGSHSDALGNEAQSDCEDCTAGSFCAAGQGQCETCHLAISAHALGCATAYASCRCRCRCRCRPLWKDGRAWPSSRRQSLLVAGVLAHRGLCAFRLARGHCTRAADSAPFNVQDPPRRSRAPRAPTATLWARRRALPARRARTRTRSAALSALCARLAATARRARPVPSRAPLARMGTHRAWRRRRAARRVLLAALAR